MIRRHALTALAVLAMGLVVSAPAEAGGTSGAVGVKKNANVIVKNTTTSAYYVLVIPESLDSSTKFGEPGTVGWAKKLGAASVSPGRSLTYPVPAGPGGILIWAPGAVPSDPKADLPDPATGAGYTVNKGKNVTKTIKAGPVIE
jgi:hypothetical protein